MDSNILLLIIVAIVVGEYLVSEWLSYRNLKAASSKIPTQLAGLYDEEKYAKQQKYFRTNNRFSLITSTFSTLVMLAMLKLQAFGTIYEYCTTISQNVIVQTLIFMAIIFMAYDILTLPFQIYDTFVIEERFGFNKTTPKTFILDKLKGLLLAAILGGGLISLIVWLYTILGTNFWWAAFLVSLTVSLLTTMLYSQVIVPLFNKQTPLPEGELRDEIEKFAQKADFELTNIYVIDGSKRSTKANAYFSGIGKKRRIVLYDTLIEELSVQEVVAVLAHEIGHYKKRHTLKNFIAAAIAMLIQFYVLSLALSSTTMAEAMGLTTPAFAVSLIAFAILYTPIDMVTGIIMNAISRKAEYEADNFASSNGFGEELISALKKLSVKSLSNLTPDNIYVKVHYSHPTLLQRVLAIKSEK